MPTDVEDIRARYELAASTTEDDGGLIHQLALHDLPTLLALVDRLISEQALESMQARLTEAQAVKAKAMQFANLCRTALLTIGNYWGDQTHTMPQPARRMAMHAQAALKNAERIISQQETQS